MARTKNVELSEDEIRAEQNQWLDDELTQIDDLLTRTLPDEVMQATITGDPKTKALLKSALTENRAFETYHTFNNPDFADRVMDELIGVGLIPQIVAEHPTATDIGYNGRAMFVDTANGKIPYARAGEEPDEVERGYFPYLSDEEFDKLKIIDHKYIEKTIYRFAVREKKSFTRADPLFNGFSENIRLSATYGDLSATGVTMSLRISRPSLALTKENFPGFAPMDMYYLLEKMIGAHTSMIISGETGTGKALVNDALIPTPAGFVKMGDLRVGDVVFDRLGQRTNVTGVYPQGKLPTYEVTLSDGRKVRCNDEHLWSYYTATGHNEILRTATLRELIDEGIVYKKDVYGHDANATRFRIPMNGAVDYPEKNYEVDPYVIGAFLGDGCLTNPVLTLASEDDEIPNKINELINSYGVSRNTHNYDYNFKLQSKSGHRLYKYTANVFKSVPEIIGLKSFNKYIPDMYKLGSVEQRFALLQGLFDTNGSITISEKKHNVRYCSNSKQLVEDVREVLFSLGISSTVSQEGTRADNRKPHWNLNVNMSNDLKYKLFSLRRKVRVAESIKDTGKNKLYDRVAITDVQLVGEDEMTCIYVDNDEHLFLANDYVVTHNTELLKLLVGSINFRDKIIIIEDIFETHLSEIYPQLDVLDWKTTGIVSISEHVKNALRNFPRWVLVSETRGAEAQGLLQSVLSGSPIITTLHSINNHSVPSRFVGMVAMAEGEIDLKSTRDDFIRYMGIGIHIVRKIFSDGKIQRYADEIVKFDPNSEDDMYPILRQGLEEREGKKLRWIQRFPLKEDFIEKLRVDNNMNPGDIEKMWAPIYGEKLVKPTQPGEAPKKVKYVKKVWDRLEL